MGAAEAMPIAFVGFSAIAALTWFFSYRPRLFIRVFAPRDKYRAAARVFLRDPDFGRGMRVIALLQFLMGAAFGIVEIWLSIRG